MKKSNIQASPGESLAALLVAIEAYFDCRLSDEEEKQLRRTIARTRMVHPAIDEAKAVMGLGRRSVEKRRSLRFPASVNIAASVALLVAGAWGISKYFSQPEMCIRDRTMCVPHAVMMREPALLQES